MELNVTTADGTASGELRAQRIGSLPGRAHGPHQGAGSGAVPVQCQKTPSQTI